MSAAILPAAAADIKVNSRMSYYTSEKEAEIMIYLPEGTGKALLDQTSYPLHQGVNLLSVNMQHLQPGNNERSVTVDYQGKSQEYKVNLLRLAPSDNEVKIDYSTGGLQVDGYPFLPTGFYSSLQGHNYPFLKSEVTQCINLYSPYHNIEPENHDARMKYLDLCAQLGIKVNYNVSGLSAIKGGSNTHSTASEEERFRLLREEIMRVKDHPAILSYYIADEPDGQGVSPESLERAYNLIHEVDPYHPISVVIISSLPARRYEHTYDILMADPYPIPNDQHKDLKADFIMANPPFNQKQWRAENELVDDPRWNGYEVPPTSNANYGWILNIVSKLSQNGVAGFLLANGALSDDGTELKIRQQLIENHLVEAIIILPRNLFYTTDISVTLWVLNKNKKARVVEQNGKLKRYRNREDEILFMDLRQMGSPYEKKYIELTEEDRAKVTSVYHNWQQEGYEETYENVPEFCYSASFDEVKEKGFTLVPSRYIEFVNRDENIDFDTKMKSLQGELKELLVQEEKSKADLLAVFKELGYEIEL